MADERTNKWPLIESPVTIVILSIVYLYYICIYGPRYMEKRDPYTLTTFIRYYNIFQIVTNAIITYFSIDAGFLSEGFVICAADAEYTYTGNSYKTAKLQWFLLLLKLVDYVETVTFVLRKKQSQVSFLHVYHHISTSFIVWIMVKYYGMGYSLMLPFLNCPIHVMMYTYYLFASYGPKYQKILTPIKPTITTIQMVQFIIMIIYSLQPFVFDCRLPKVLATIWLVDLVINFTLFFNFYYKNYIKKPKKERIQ